MLAAHPSFGAELLAHIRLEAVACMIGAQNLAFGSRRVFPRTRRHGS